MVTMMRNELIKLVTVLGNTKDKDGFCTEEKTVETEVFADVQSVGRTEYYEAARAGKKATIIFVVDADDYSLSERRLKVDGKEKKVSASKIIYDDTAYLIRRTYKKQGGMLEITCGEVE